MGGLRAAVRMDRGTTRSRQDAEGGGRTHTPLAGNRLLRPARLPFRHFGTGGLASIISRNSGGVNPTLPGSRGGRIQVLGGGAGGAFEPSNAVRSITARQ